MEFMLNARQTSQADNVICAQHELQRSRNVLTALLDGRERRRAV